MSVLLLGMVMLFHLTFSCAQVPPPTVRRLLALPPAGTGAVYINDLTAEEKEFYWSGTAAKDGYIEVEVSEEYLEVVAVSLRFADAEAALGGEPSIYCQLPAPYIPIGKTAESHFRSSYFFRAVDGSRIMTTVWQYRKEKASFYIVADFLNGKINGNLAIISRGISKAKSDKSVWKVTWVSSDEQFELYVQPEANKYWNTQKVTRLASALRCAPLQSR